MLKMANRPVKNYNWIVERARSGEPVPIDTDRPDINRIINFLMEIDGRDLSIQSDNEFGLLWVVKSNLEGKDNVR